MTSPSPSTEVRRPTRAHIVVIGSANYDRTVRVRATPLPGETVRGITQTTDVGGKGVNQAVASARAGAVVRFIGSVGRDAAGAEVARRLTENGIDVGRLAHVAEPTGTAFITVTEEGENTIVLLAGANDVWTIDDDQLLRSVGSARIVVTQAEIPGRVQRQITRVARALGVPVMLTAAPVGNVAVDVLPSVRYLLVNEEEAVQLSGESSVVDAAVRLSTRIEKEGWCIVTRGAREILAATAGRVGFAMVPPRVLSPRDTTAAGDTFAGWCAAGLAAGCTLEGAIREASMAASLSVTRPGASSSIPDRTEIGRAREVATDSPVL